MGELADSDARIVLIFEFGSVCSVSRECGEPKALFVAFIALDRDLGLCLYCFLFASFFSAGFSATSELRRS